MKRQVLGIAKSDLLALALIAGVVPFIALPSIRPSFGRQRQRAAMADIRAIAVAVEAYAVDNVVFPAGGYSFIATASALYISGQLAPTYIKQVPLRDPWARIYFYGNSANSQMYQVRSSGRDGIDNTGLNGATFTEDDDIVFQNGQFVVWPTGLVP